MNVLVTGASGMIGAHLVKGLLNAGHNVVGIDRRKSETAQVVVDLDDKQKLSEIVKEFKVDRIIHLAALAHAVDGKEFTWEDYKHLNVDCAKNIFDTADERPVLFISTVDVLGYTKGVVNEKTPMKPVSNYGKSKMMAEQEVEKLKHYDIFRFSPVYTDTIKRDIQKRYYLKYPNIAYRIGKGTEYEILNIERAVQSMIAWCSEEPKNKVRIIKDENIMWTPDYIKAEKKEGRSKIVIWVPQWMANLGYVVLKGITGENKYTYLLNKAVHPVRSETL